MKKNPTPAETPARVRIPRRTPGPPIPAEAPTPPEAPPAPVRAAGTHPVLAIAAGPEAPVAPLRALFPDEAEYEKFVLNIPVQLAQSWGDNNPIRAVLVNPAFLEEVTAMFLGAENPGLPPQLQAIVDQEKRQLVFIPEPHVPHFQVVTLRDQIGVQETLYLKHWAAQEARLYNFWEKKGVEFLPSTQELRLAFLFWSLQEIQRTERRIESASGVGLPWPKI